jgi:DNA-binding GntR family transcriptional regulator
MSDTATPLQKTLVERIAQLVHEDALQPGSRLNESKLAQRLSVSRSPIRAALKRLAEDGFVELLPNRGMALIAPPPLALAPDVDSEAKEQLIRRIAKDRRENKLPSAFTEAELMRLYDEDRKSIRDALEALEHLGAVERKPGYGWRFPDAIRDEQSRRESFRFRMLIECGAIMEPGFELPCDWADDMREQHNRFLVDEWNDTSSIALFEMNAAFHLGICSASGNRYLAEAMHRQNQLRRLSNYNWKHGRERVIVTCTEHLEILDRLVSGDNEVAAALMRRHLMSSWTQLSPSAAP